MITKSSANSKYYKAYLKTVYNENSNSKDNYSSEAVFFITQKGIKSTDSIFKLQSLTFIKEPYIEINNGITFLHAEAHDLQGFSCLFSMYTNLENNKYVIIISYNDITFLYECKINE